MKQNHIISYNNFINRLFYGILLKIQILGTFMTGMEARYYSMWKHEMFGCYKGYCIVLDGNKGHTGALS